MWSIYANIITEIEGFYNLIGYLIIQIGNYNERYQTLVKNILSNSSIDNQLKYKIINNLLNNLSNKEDLKVELYKSILEKEQDFITKDDDDLINWFNDLEVETKKSFLLEIINHFNRIGDINRVVKYQQLLIELDNSNDVIAKSLIINSLELLNNYSFDQLLQLNGIININNSVEFNLLQSYINLDYNEFNKSISQLDNVNKALLVDKFRLLQLNNYCSDFIGKSINYNDLSGVLGIEESNIELILIQLIKSGLTLGRLNQSTKQFKVNQSIKFKFNKADWLELSTKLQKFKLNLNNILLSVN